MTLKSAALPEAQGMPKQESARAAWPNLIKGNLLLPGLRGQYFQTFFHSVLLRRLPSPFVVIRRVCVLPVRVRIEVDIQNFRPNCGLHQKLSLRNQLGEQLDFLFVELEHAL